MIVADGVQILVCAVALELLPVAIEPDASWWAGPLGFSFGVVFFIVLGKVRPYAVTSVAFSPSL